eukprot:354792-Chlamydomonas_euryale.AAC.7
MEGLSAQRAKHAGGCACKSTKRLQVYIRKACQLALVTNVTTPGLAVYYAILVLQVLAIRDHTPQVRKPHGTP